MTVLEGQYSSRITAAVRSGFIYDSKGKILSHSLDGKVLLINPAKCENALEYAQKLSNVSSVSTSSEIYEKILEGVPFTMVVKNVRQDLNLEGVYVFDRYKEENNIARHFIGYTRNGRGESGLRREYDSYLGGTLYSSVSAVFETDAKRKSLSPFEIDCEKYLSKDGIVTTLDKDLQNFCDSLENDVVSGAVVVADAQNGNILSLSSFPSYDEENLGKFLNSDKGELVNRVTENFTPGSVFKMIVSASALELDENYFDYKYNCEGSVLVDGNTFHCHKRDGHGEISMLDAFSLSCNTYFISLGREIGLLNIADTMIKLGLDANTKADFLTEKTNFFINTQNDLEGYLANISFGQGDLCLSPLDMIKVTSCVSTGILMPLSTIRGKVENGRLCEEKQKSGERIFSENTSEKMALLMNECVVNGTGKAGYTKKIKVGGKTATAQTGRYNGEGVEYVHKWFCGVAETEDKKYSILVLFDFSTQSEKSPAVVFRRIAEFLAENPV